MPNRSSFHRDSAHYLIDIVQQPVEGITRAGYSILFAHPIKYAFVLRYSKHSDVGIAVTNIYRGRARVFCLSP